LSVFFSQDRSCVVSGRVDFGRVSADVEADDLVDEGALARIGNSQNVDSQQARPFWRNSA
jgi:hypothetical protein